VVESLPGCGFGPAAILGASRLTADRPWRGGVTAAGCLRSGCDADAVRDESTDVLDRDATGITVVSLFNPATHIHHSQHIN